MSAFLQINQQLLAELLIFIDFADNKLTIGFVCINFAKDRNTLIEILKNHEQCKDIQFEILTFNDAQLRFLRDAIVAELSKITIQENKKLVLIIVGLEKSIGMSGEYPPVLQDLNFVRDAFTTSVPHPILFFLPDYALTRLAKYAPDVWAWRKGVFEFKTVQSTKEYAIEKTLNSDRILGSLELLEKQERIDLLERLLMEATDIPNRVNILKELGVAYGSIGEPRKAEDFLQDALKLTDDAENLISIKASILYEISNIYLGWGNLASAIALFQQSLDLYEKIGDVQGKASSLHLLAIIYARRGDVDRAIALFQQSLDLYEKIGDVQGKAASLHQLAGIYASRGDVDRAIALYQQSLDLYEKIGDVQGKAMTLWWLGHIAQQQGDNITALEYLQESFDILQRIKSPDAQRLKGIIDGITPIQPED
jgi:tetratricopeptide (TPR) repeat protein